MAAGKPTPPHPVQIETNHKRLDNVLKEWPPLGGKGLLALGRCRAGRRKDGGGEGGLWGGDHASLGPWKK